jgi:ribonuclease P protein subunit RPR2
MAKAKAQGGVKRVQNRHCYSRIAFLHQAAQHLASKQLLSEPEVISPGTEVVDIPSVTQNTDKQTQTVASASPTVVGKSSDQTPSVHATDGFGLSRRFASHILAVSRKASIKASREMKRSICKRCCSILIPGQTADYQVENKSRGGHKSCADIMLVTCSACGFEKRYPFGAQGQPRKKDRVAASKSVGKMVTRDPDHGG